jgi:2-methylcitrate dehydratase PrpD
MTTHLSVTQRLARWASDLQGGAIPAAVRAHAKTSLIDTTGVAIAGSQTRVGRMARAVGLQAGSHGWSTLFGCNAHVSEQTAAFVNGASAHALDFDDNCYAGVVHGSAVIAPAALAVGPKGQRLRQRPDHGFCRRIGMRVRGRGGIKEHPV